MIRAWLLSASTLEASILDASKEFQEEHPRIREVRITAAACEKIRAFWWAVSAARSVQRNGGQ
jgi:hypothetical protein